MHIDENESQEFWKQVQKSATLMSELDRQYLEEYKDLVDMKQLNARTLVTVRCSEKKCIMMRVYRTRGRTMFYRPPYRLSAAQEEALTTRAGRRNHTLEGGVWEPECHELPRTEWNDGIEARCRHASKTIPYRELHALAQGATPGQPRTLMLE